MTARLVALMSTLLFLSLLAFILLVRQSEEAVMAEVGKTVSKVGLETVRAVMSHGMASYPAGEGTEADEGAPAVARGWSRSFVVRTSGSGVEIPSGEFAGAVPAFAPAAGTDTKAVPAKILGQTETQMATIGNSEVHSFGVEAAAQVIPEETATGTRYRIVLPGPEGGATSGLLELVWSGSEGKAPSDSTLRRAALCRALLGSDGAGIEFSQIGLPRVPIQVDTEKDGTMQVAIRLVATDSDLGDPAALKGFPHDGNLEEGALVFIDDIQRRFPRPSMADLLVNLEEGEDGVTERQTVFQMSTRDYGAVFEALRGRMWALFAVVALVGTLLSAGLARRFTRPVRDLDTAIRRLSRDDLDVQVEVTGGGEVGRLTTAFNEMARRLRIARERSRELTRRERLSALGRLAAGVAHDVRNPLHSINLSLQHLQETCRPGDPSGQEFDRTVGIIRGEIRRLDGLVSNFLRFARTGAGDRRAISVDHLLQETGDVVAKEALARGVLVRVFADSQGAVVLAEGESLRSALLNLVLNSFEATPKGGVISLRSRLVGGVVTLEVADTGAGIPAEDREQIFDFGFTSREDGHGLGLAMVHEIVVEENDGRIEVESEEGVGTTIRIELPVFEPETAEASA